MKSAAEAIFIDGGKSEVVIEQGKSRNESVNKYSGKSKGDNSDVAKSRNKNINEVPDCSKTFSKKTKGRNQDSNDHENSESIEQERHGKEINKDNSEIMVEVRTIEKESIKNDRDNGDIVKSGNQTIEYVRECLEIVIQKIKGGYETINKDKDMSEQSKGGNQGNHDFDNYAIVTESVKSGKVRATIRTVMKLLMKKWIQVVDIKKQKIPKEMMNLVLIVIFLILLLLLESYRMVKTDHQSDPSNVSSDSELENVIIRRKKINQTIVTKMRSECVLKFVHVYEEM